MLGVVCKGKKSSSCNEKKSRQSAKMENGRRTREKNRGGEHGWPAEIIMEHDRTSRRSWIVIERVQHNEDECTP